MALVDTLRIFHLNRGQSAGGITFYPEHRGNAEVQVNKENKAVCPTHHKPLVMERVPTLDHDIFYVCPEKGCEYSIPGGI